jgi:hypothetical protein
MKLIHVVKLKASLDAIDPVHRSGTTIAAAQLVAMPLR